MVSTFPFLQQIKNCSHSFLILSFWVELMDIGINPLSSKNIKYNISNPVRKLADDLQITI